MEQESSIINDIGQVIKKNKVITGAIAATLLWIGMTGYEYRDGLKITKRDDGSFEKTEIVGRGGNPLNRHIQKSRTTGKNLNEDKIRQEAVDLRNQMKEENQKRENHN